MAWLAAHALPARAADLSVTSGTFTVTAPGDVPQSRVVVDNTTDAAATLKIDTGVTFGKDILLNNGGSLINEGTIFRTGSGVDGVFGNVGLAQVTNQAGGTITVDDIGMWLKADGTVLNTGAGTSINGRIGIDIVGTADVTNELGAEINAGTGAGLYLSEGTVINRSGATIASDGAEGVRMSGTGNVTNTDAGSAISGGTLGVVALGAGSSLINENGATIYGGTRGADIFGDITNTGAGSKISSDGDGVRTQGGATLRNEDGAEIEAEYLAVDMYDGGDVHNTGGSRITSNSTDGIDVWIYGSVTNSGEGSAITAGGYAGVYFNPYDPSDEVFALTNSDKATIQGDSYGVSFDGAAGTVINEGGATITSVSGSGVAMNYGGSVTNQSGGVITGPVSGLYLNSPDAYTVINTGAGSKISATFVDTTLGGDAVFIAGPATVTNADGAVIDGTRFGVWLSDGGSLTNEGEDTNITGGFSAVLASESADIINRTGASISGGEFGLRLKKGGTVSNDAQSSISGDTGFFNEADDVGVTNEGLIGGDLYAAVKVLGETTLTNSGGDARIEGVTKGIDAEGGGSFTNTLGASISASDGAAGIGVYLFNGGALTNKSSATIYGGLRGVQGWGADIVNTGNGSAITSSGTAVQTWAGGGSVTNADGATMHGGESGILLDISTALENSSGATIIGDTVDGVLSYNGGIVTNSGEGSAISGAVAGVELQGGPGTVINADGATIEGGYGAIGLFQGGSVTNGAGSTLTGGTFGIYVEGGGATVSNAGAINGDVDLDGGYDNAVTLFTGGSIDGNLYINNRATSTLTFDGAGTQRLSDAVTGTFAFGGLLTKQGAGTWIIDKDLLANQTNVTGGSLIVGIDGHGKLVSDVHVSPGALLGGSGAIYGNVTVDGTVAPGNSPGVLTVIGNYTQAAGSTFEAQIDTDSGLYDQISASGTVTIDPGATLNVTHIGSAPYVVGTQYVFVSATNVSGSYAVTGDLVISPFLTLTDHYTPGIGYLQVQQTMSLAAGVPSTSTNQLALVNAIQPVPTNPIYVALTNLPSLAALNTALSQLSGELYPSMTGAMLEDSRYLRNAVIDRLQDAPCTDIRLPQGNAGAGCGSRPARFWSSAIGAWAHNNSAANVASMSRMTGGMLYGVDTTVNDFWRTGLLAGYGVSHFEMNNLASSATSDDYHLGLYAGTLPGQAAVKLGALRTWHHISAGRTVDFPGFHDRLNADYHAATTQVFGEAGYRLAATDNRVEPFVNVTYADNRVADFGESGGAAALAGLGGNSSLVLSTFGVHLNNVFQTGTAKIAAKGTLGWRNASGDTTPASNFEIGGGSAYRIDGLPIPRNALMARADIEVAMSEAVTLGLSGDGQFARDAAALGLQARLAINF